MSLRFFCATASHNPRGGNMKNKLAKKLTNVFLATLMLFSCFTVSLKAEETEKYAELVTDVSELKTGDQVLIVNKAHSKALSQTYNGYYNTGADVAVTDGRINDPADNLIWTIEIDEDGNYIFKTASGSRLSMDTSYSSTPLDKVNDRWTVLPASTAGCSYIKNVGRNQYLEWYADKNNWSAYGSLNNEALFAHQFYLLKEGTAPEPTDPILVTSVSLDRESAALEEGKTIQLTAEVLPENADDKSLTWASDDEDVAIVDQTGLVTAVAEGTATITVTTNDGSDLSAACTVTVTKADTPIDPEEPEEIEEGLITDLSQLKDGSKVVIYNQNNDLAMTSETYRDWYLLGSAVTIEDDKVVSPADNLIWEVTVNDNGTYTFKQGDKTVGTWLSGTLPKAVWIMNGF